MISLMLEFLPNWVLVPWAVASITSCAPAAMARNAAAAANSASDLSFVTMNCLLIALSLTDVPGSLLLPNLAHDDVGQAPHVLAQLQLQFTVLVDRQLCRRIKDSGALAGVLGVDLYVSARQVIRLRRCVPKGFAELDFAIGEKANGASGRSRLRRKERNFITHGSRYLDSSHRAHLVQGLHESVVLPRAECLFQFPFVFFSRVIRHQQLDGDDLSQLGAGAPRLGVDDFQ